MSGPGTKREKRRETVDRHGRTFVDPVGESLGVGRLFYVTVIDGARTGFLLGPYDTHGEALAKVDLGRKLAESSDPFAKYAYGTSSAPPDVRVETVFGQDGCSACARAFPRFMGRVRHCPYCGAEARP